MVQYLDFESKLEIINNKIIDLQKSEINHEDLNFEKEINSLQKQYTQLLQKIYSSLTPKQKVSVARHPERPHTIDYINNIVKDFTPLAGDRLFAEDKAIISGIGRIKNNTFFIIGIEKGHDTESRLIYNFGMPKPEGYRKAQRLMKLANKLKIPVVTFIDTSGAYPGKEAEERGQGEAIAKSIATCLEINVPLINVIIGEGGSGGAIALAAGDYVMMLEHSIYSVISPEGCASILYRDEKMASEAAKSLKLTSDDLYKFGIIDKIIPEVVGGAHRDKNQQYIYVEDAITDVLKNLLSVSEDKRKINKHNKILKIGQLQKSKWFK